MPGFFVLLEATSPRLSRPANDYIQIPTGHVVEVGTQVTIQGLSPSIPYARQCDMAEVSTADEHYEIAWNQQISPGCLLR
jgi:hypothetical protein